MLLEEAWRFAFRHFSTLFLIVAVVVIPLHLGYSVAFRNTIAVREFRSQIERFPEYRKVREVGPAELQSARLAYLSLNVIELLLLPLAIGAAARVVTVDRQGNVPTATDAWRSSLRHTRGLRGGGFNPAALVLAAVVALVVGGLVERIGLLLAEPMSPDVAFVAIGLVQAVARAVATPFFLTPAAIALSPKGVAPIAPTY